MLAGNEGDFKGKFVSRNSRVARTTQIGLNIPIIYIACLFIIATIVTMILLEEVREVVGVLDLLQHVCR